VLLSIYMTGFTNISWSDAKITGHHLSGMEPVLAPWGTEWICRPIQPRKLTEARNGMLWMSGHFYRLYKPQAMHIPGPLRQI